MGDFDVLDNFEKVHKATRSAEEIESLTIDPGMSNMQKVHQLLTKGLPIQKESIIMTFHRYLRDFKEEAPSRFLPLILPAVRDGSPAFQIQAAEMFRISFQEGLFTAEAVRLLYPTLSAFLQQHDENVSLAYLDSMLMCLELLPREMLRKRGLRAGLLAAACLQAAGPAGPAHRPVRADLPRPGLLAHHPPPPTPTSAERAALQAIMERSLALCQDPEYEIRTAMCDELEPVARGVGVELASTRVLTELMRLLNDEVAAVRVSALQSLARLLDAIDLDARNLRVGPAVRKLCIDGRTDPTAAALTAPALGMFVWKIQALDGTHPLEHGDHVTWATTPSACCAPSLTAALLAGCAHRGCACDAMARAVGQKRYAAQLHATCQHMARDENEDVRMAIAAGLHEIVQLAGKDRAKLIPEMLEGLLGDSSPKVQQALAEHLEAVLTPLAAASEESKATVLASVERLLGPTTLPMRVRQTLVEQLGHADAFFSLAQLRDTLLPALLRTIQLEAFPIKQAAIPVMVRGLRALRIQKNRNDLITRLTCDFGRGRSYQLRLLFLEMVPPLARTFSRRFFRMYFFEPALDLTGKNMRTVFVFIFGARLDKCAPPLAGTPGVPAAQIPLVTTTSPYPPPPPLHRVANVRRRAALVLQTLRVAVGPMDGASLDRITGRLGALLTDSDREVRATAQQVENALGRNDGRRRGGSPAMSPEDALDARLQDEEDRWEQEEREREAAEASAASRPTANFYQRGSRIAEARARILQTRIKGIVSPSLLSPTGQAPSTPIPIPTPSTATATATSTGTSGPVVGSAPSSGGRRTPDVRGASSRADGGHSAGARSNRLPSPSDLPPRHKSPGLAAAAGTSAATGGTGGSSSVSPAPRPLRSGRAEPPLSGPGARRSMGGAGSSTPTAADLPLRRSLVGSTGGPGGGPIAGSASGVASGSGAPRPPVAPTSGLGKPSTTSSTGSLPPKARTPPPIAVPTPGAAPRPMPSPTGAAAGTSTLTASRLHGGPAASQRRSGTSTPPPAPTTAGQPSLRPLVSVPGSGLPPRSGRTIKR
ncbi:putative serine/threonine-protein phosphatase 4 regulatory subunit 4 [Paratrimastix pyriformis]|uniref:Serine/threonine-protein phosphatase 4 regulatory subunit 4 n=1 Tax=Paratrimastix pyriformis TaxID=342808 RepID=A0ABQ8UU34_9EUKA|nr:putative serine/threonine-protein phosphatase 4 regulatory subunit 4 [Paratrimastix pyriformis]